MAESPPQSAPGFFLTIGVNGDGVIAVAADRPGEDDKRPHVELADLQAGIAWLPARVNDLRRRYPRARFAANRAGPVAALVESGTLPYVELMPPGEIAQACRHHEQMHTAAGYTHSDDPDVDASFRGAVSKPAGDGLWTWDWRNSTSLAPLAAVTGALWIVEKYRGHMYDLLDSVR